MLDYKFKRFIFNQIVNKGAIGDEIYKVSTLTTVFIFVSILISAGGCSCGRNQTITQTITNNVTDIQGSVFMVGSLYYEEN